MLDKLAQGIAVEGMESLAPALVERMVPVLDLVPDDSLVVMVDPERVRRRAHDLVATTQEFLEAAWTSAAAGAATPLDLSAASFASFAEIRALSAVRGLGLVDALAVLPGRRRHRGREARRLLRGVDRHRAPRGPERGAARERMADDLAATAHTVVIAARDVERYRGEVAARSPTSGSCSRPAGGSCWPPRGTVPRSAWSSSSRPPRCPRGWSRRSTDEPEGGVVLVVPAPVGPGFVAEPLQLAVFSESDLTGRAGTSTRDMRKMPSRRATSSTRCSCARTTTWCTSSTASAGSSSSCSGPSARGPPRRRASTWSSSTRPASGAAGDRLFVPSDQLDQVTKYVGGEAPSLSKMGGGDWAKTKGRAKKAVKEIAAELIRLYSARMATAGHAFGPDTPWQRELEDAFAYVETPDQAATIDEVKADMEKPIPMDRLVCGDVGYGKTEIAVRAAFKAVQDGKQVAILVPTTLLVQQHLDTFSERYSAFPSR